MFDSLYLEAHFLGNHLHRTMRSWKEQEFKIGHRRQRDKFPALIVLEYEKIVLQAKGQRSSKSVSFPKLMDHQH